MDFQTFGCVWQSHVHADLVKGSEGGSGNFGENEMVKQLKVSLACA